MNELVSQVLNEQLDYLKKNHFKSYDLCDITSQPYFLKMNTWCHKNPIGKYVKYPHNILIDRFTPELRKLYQVEKRDFAQSNAFIVRGLLGLYEKTNEEQYRKEVTSLIERILQQKSEGFEHLCWGQPYDWFSKKIIPANTPRTTVTSQVGKMFLDAYETLDDKTYLANAIDVGEFFMDEMPLSLSEGNSTCYSYTTIDKHQVHNPNMMVSGFLARLHHHTKEEKYIERAISAATFTFNEINADGSWYYAKLPDNKKSKIDNYHTGYNIEGALLLKKYLKEKFMLNEELERSIEFYSNHLFDDRGIPFLTTTKKNTIDIQCCAQSIITYSYLSLIDKKFEEKAQELYKWTTSNMYEKGSYYYRVSKNGSIDKTDYIRWGDAWMFYAGSLLL